MPSAFFQNEKTYLHIVMDLKSVIEIKKVLHFVIGNFAVNHRVFAGVDHDKRELDGSIGSGGTGTLFLLLVALDQVFESNLLKWRKCIRFFVHFRNLLSLPGE